MKSKHVVFIYVIGMLLYFCHPAISFSQSQPAPGLLADTLRPKDKDDILLNYVMEINLDTQRHREFIKELYVILFTALGVIGTLITGIGGFLAFFGVKTVRDVTIRFEELAKLKENLILKISELKILETEIDTTKNSMTKSMQEFGSKIANFEDEIKHFETKSNHLTAEINDLEGKVNEQNVKFEEKLKQFETKSNDLIDEINDLEGKMNEQNVKYEGKIKLYETKSSTITADMNDLEGKMNKQIVRFETYVKRIDMIENKQQETNENLEMLNLTHKTLENVLSKNGQTNFEYISADRRRVKIIKNRLLTNYQDVNRLEFAWEESIPSGKINNVDCKEPLSFEFDPMDSNVCTFKLPLEGGSENTQVELSCTLEILDGFSGEVESYIITQRTQWEDEKFIIKFLKGMYCKEVVCEERINNAFEPTNVVIKTEGTDIHDIHTVLFPDKTPPNTYRILWKF